MTQVELRQRARELRKAAKKGGQAEEELERLQRACHHPRRSNPKTESGGGGTELSSKDRYTVCLDCGHKQYL